MVKSIALLAILLGSGVSAQSVSYSTNNPSRLKGDPNKLVCEKEDKIGTRLGGEKVCHTIAEWDQIRLGTQENLDRLQAGTWGPCSGAPGQCGANGFSIGDLTAGGGGSAPH